MLLKCTRENETTYYIPSHIQKITISAVYGREDCFDVSLEVAGQLEIIRMFDSEIEAEKYVQELYQMILTGKENNSIVDLNK